MSDETARARVSGSEGAEAGAPGSRSEEEAGGPGSRSEGEADKACASVDAMAEVGMGAAASAYRADDSDSDASGRGASSSL